jgi:hypothetical protein
MEQIPGFVYCGDACWGYPRSPLYNPYHKEKITQEEKVAKYRAYLMERIDAGDLAILDALDALKKDSLLGCWCVPKPCHCDVIAEVWATLHAGAAS